jgi:hypothetical protein
VRTKARWDITSLTRVARRRDCKTKVIGSWCWCHWS